MLKSYVRLKISIITNVYLNQNESIAFSKQGDFFPTKKENNTYFNSENLLYN